MTAPDEDIGADVNTWINVVRRSRLPATTKLIALLMASYADPDGTNIYPGVARLAIQSGHGYRTVQREQARLRAMGFVQSMPRRGLRRGWSTPYRLILAADLLEHVDVPSPATEDARIDELARRYRGRHRAKASTKQVLEHVPNGTTARSPDGVQFSDCTPWDDTTARHGQAADLQKEHQTLHVPPPETNPPSAESSVVARGTGSARARDRNENQIDHRQREMDKLMTWIREHPERTS